MANKVRSEDFADILQWVALGLFIVFLAILLAAMLPLEILDSRWQVKVISALLGSASLLKGLAHLDPRLVCFGA
ncbi:MAG: hypothetical protein NT158_09610 [Cyanobacteria bacterium]|nr:hypothetical protein [Cyanobacteriota bacterium]